MSKTQKKLLYELINSNDKLQQEKSDGPSLSCQTKRKEWKKIALKLNSVTGPQKTWSQWKKVQHFELLQSKKALISLITVLARYSKV